MSLLKNNTSGYTWLLAENIDQLPNVTFNPNITELSSEFKCIAENLELRADADNVNLDTSKLVTAQCEQYNKLKANPELELAFGAFDKLASKLSSEIGSVFQILANTIHPEVEQLTREIDERLVQLLKADNKEVVLNIDNTEITPLEFEFVRWDDLIHQFGGEDVIISSFQGLMGSSALNFGTSDFSFTSDTREKLCITFSGDESTIKGLDSLDKTLAEYKEQFSDCPEKYQNLEETLQLLLGRYGEFRLPKPVNLYLSGNPLATVFNTTVDFIKKHIDCIPLIKKMTFNFNNFAQQLLTHNLEALENQLTLCAYLLLICRKSYHDILIIGGKQLNGDLAEAMQESQLTFNDITIFLMFVHRQDTVELTDNDDYSLKDIKDAIEDAHKFIEQRRRNLLTNATATQITYKHRAVSEILVEYLENTDVTRVPMSTPVDQFIHSQRVVLESRLRSLDSGDDNNLNSFLYKFIIDTYYSGTIIATAHELFGKEMTELLQTKASFDGQDVDKVNISVAAKLAANFLMSTIIQIQD